MLQFKQSAFRTSSNDNGSSAVDTISEVRIEQTAVQQTPISRPCTSEEGTFQGTQEI
jgi:hypothetical protein